MFDNELRVLLEAQTLVELGVAEWVEDAWKRYPPEIGSQSATSATTPSLSQKVVQVGYPDEPGQLRPGRAGTPRRRAGRRRARSSSRARSPSRR